MAFDIRQVDLNKLNSMTKYPSILTYHTLGDKGVLQEAVQVRFAGRVRHTDSEKHEEPFLDRARDAPIDLDRCA